MYNKKNDGGTVELSTTPKELKNGGAVKDKDNENLVKNKKNSSEKIPEGYYRQRYKMGML